MPDMLLFQFLAWFTLCPAFPLSFWTHVCLLLSISSERFSAPRRSWSVFFFRLAPTRLRRRLVGKLAALRAGQSKSFKRNKQQAKKTPNFPVLSVMEIAFGHKLPTAKTRWKLSSTQCSVSIRVYIRFGWSQCKAGANAEAEVETEAATATANLHLQPRSCAPPCKRNCCAQLFWKSENCACEPSAKSFTPNKRQSLKQTSTSSRFQLWQSKTS